MDESESKADSDGNTSQNGGATPQNIVKPKRRSLVERELETNLTARVTSPVASGEAKGTTSRYGRSRRLKTHSEFCESDKAVTAMFKSSMNEQTPSKSPAYKMNASNSKRESPKTPIMETTSNIEHQIENIMSNNATLSRFSTAESNDKSPTKKFSKIYTRKDLIQSKEKEETVSIMKNMFSPTKSSYKASTNTHLSNILERSSEKYNLNVTETKPNGYKDTLSVVKTLDFDTGKKKKLQESAANNTISKSELFEREAKSEYQVGDLAWSRVGTYPFWPCIITRDPFSGIFVKKKLFGRVERDVFHVTFFGDNGRRGWIVDNMLRRYQGLEEFEATRDGFTPQSKKKDPRLYSAFFVSDKKRHSWDVSVQEAEILMREPKRFRIDALNEMLSKTRVMKTTPKRQRSEKIVRTDSDVSLSESLYDTLFSEDDTKGEELDKSKNKPRKKSLDVSDVVTACLDNMAAKTGISKIQKQSHMDRWLQKAKSKTPEKIQNVFGPTKSRNELKGSHSGKRSRKTPLKDQRTLILKNKCGGNDSDCLGMLRITTAFQLNDHDYTKLDTENANPENNQNRNTQDNNIIIVNGVVTDKSCGIGIISKVESLYNRSMSEDKTTETFDIENNMTVAGEELIVTETDETTVRTDDKGLKVSEHKTDAQEQISDNIQNIMDVDFQDISIKNQDKMDVDTPESVEDNSQKDLVNAEGPQTSEKTMRSNNEGLQNRESPSYRVTRRSKRLSLDPKTKIKSSEVTDGKIYGDISFENKSNENNKNMKSSKSLEKSASKKNKNIINVGDKPSENEIQEKTKDNLSKYDIEIKLESRTNSDHITNGVRDNLSGSSCHTNKGDLLDVKYVNLTRNDSKTIEKSTKNDSFTKVANIAVSSDVSKILEDFSEMDDDSQLGDVRVTLPEPMPVNGDINHVHIEKVTTKDEVIENSDQNSPIEVNKPLNREDIMDRNGDVNHDEESTELVADTTQSLVVKKSPKLVLSNGDLETDAESLHDKSTKCTDIKDVEDVGLKQQISNESPEIELTPLEEIFAAQLEAAKQNNRKSKNSQEIKKDYVLHSNTLIHEALDINEFNCDVKKPLETEDVQNLDKEHSEPMEVNDDAPESAIESDETARDALDDVENSFEPESPMYEETLLVEEPNNIEIVCNSGSIEQTNHKNNTEIGQDKNMSASSEPRTYSYDDKLVTLKEFKVKVTRMPMESFQNNLVSLKEKESFQQNPVKPTEKEPLQEILPERTEKAESQKNLEKPLEGRPLQKNLAEVAEKVPLQNNFDGPIEKETLDKNSDEASKRETLQQNSEEDTKLGKNIGTVNDIPQKNGELLEKETILSNLEKTTQLTATSDQKSDTVEETVVKSECGSTDSDFEDNISIAAMCRSYSEESRESKSAQNSTKECAKPKRKPSKDKNTTQPRMEMHQALENPEFLKYIELRQDALIDENPHVTEDEVVEYLFKTWLYSENLKSETVKSFDKEQSTLVKGLGDEPPPQPKKIRKKIKVEKEKDKEPQSTEEIVPKDRSKRKVARAYYNENDTDLEEELQVFEIFKMVNKQPAKPKGENAESPNTDAISMEEEKEKPEPDNYIVDEVEMFFSQLAKPKPNVFKGIPRERLCEICERPGSLIKCKGLCGGMFHLDCVRREIEAPPKTDGPNRTRKRKKPRGRKPKNLDDSGSQSDDKKDLNLSDETIADEIQLENNLVIDADNFESQLEAKMQEMLKTELPADYDYSSEEELQWNDTATGKCEIVEVKLKLKRPENEYGEFKCNGCLKNEIPVCFVCKSTTSPKNSVELRQKCQTAHCHKYYHLECLDVWPQTQFSGGEPSRNNKKISETFEALTCPRHVCHTCVCDDPRGCNTRFSGDKLARCVRCPATYHSFNKCLPAGSTILSASHIVCPRHYEHRPGKIPCHVNTGWCFICALGGTLICCEYCPTSFHAECLNIKPPEGNYMCEDCETGRLPLYGEMMWVKLGHYRWWPGIILHPCEIPANIMAVRHSSGEFVVRFFGQYDHYWVNRGRVFPFLEGDSGKLSGQKSKIDEAFTMAMEHAQRACEILKNAAPNEEEDTDIASSLLPPHYVKLKVNKPCGALVNYKLDDEENSLTLCECDPNDIEPCGPDTHCLNRMLLTECGPTCRAGDRCRNRAFEMRAYPKLTHYRTSWGGWGLKTLEPIRQGQFVIEYVGELLDEAEFRRRMQRKHETRDENYYFLTLDRDRMIDAGPKGNLARFMNHCCEPNCETQKWTVLGDVRVGLFALRDIPANSEVTFNYNLECAGIEKKPCLCGAKRCSGYIGAKPKQEEAQPKKSKLHTKRPYKKRKPNVENSPSTSKTKVVKPRMTQRSRPKEVKELTEIEKDLLIIKNATNGLSSDSETCARLSSVDTEKLVKDDSKPLKRKRVSFSKDEVVLCNGDVEHSPSAKKVKLETLSGVGD